MNLCPICPRLWIPRLWSSRSPLLVIWRHHPCPVKAYCWASLGLGGHFPRLYFCAPSIMLHHALFSRFEALLLAVLHVFSCAFSVKLKKPFPDCPLGGNGQEMVYSIVIHCRIASPFLLFSIYAHHSISCCLNFFIWH